MTESSILEDGQEDGQNKEGEVIRQDARFEVRRWDVESCLYGKVSCHKSKNVCWMSGHPDPRKKVRVTIGLSVNWKCASTFRSSSELEQHCFYMRDG